MRETQRWLQVVNAASSIAELVREKQFYRFGVRPETTLYLHVEGAEVHIHRWELPTVEIKAHIQIGLGWRIAHDQDDVGVYFVARRRRIVGSLAGGTFTVTLPQDAHLILRLERCRLWAVDVSGQIELPANGILMRTTLPERI